MPQFVGKIEGVQLYNLMPSSVRLVGHMNDTACTITIETSRETAKSLEAAFRVDADAVHIQISNGGEL